MVGKRQSLISNIVIYGVLILLAFVWTVPTVGLLVSSFRPKDDVSSSGWWSILSEEGSAPLSFNNYRIVLGIAGEELQAGFTRGEETIQLLDAVLNSLTVSIPATIIPGLVAGFAAYGFAWMRLAGRRHLFIGVVGMLVVPLQIALIPLLKYYIALDLSGAFMRI